MNSLSQLVQQVKNANWSSANQVFAEIMQQKVADRLASERASIFKEESDTEYQAYFRDQLKKHNYDSPADIPDDKKDDFFKAVDQGYKAKNESYKLSEDKKPYAWECMECGNIWRDNQSGQAGHVKCPKCRSTDVEPGTFTSKRA